MLEVFDKNRKKIGILDKAFDISEDLKLNALNTMSFSLPADDTKNRFCAAFNLVCYDNGELYRVVGLNAEESNDEKNVYECEHVLALLLNTTMFGYHIVGNLGVYTKDCINYVLSKQSNWVLDRCEFNHQYEYGWEQENCLGALFSTPRRFVEKYKWVTNTSVYPYKISLLKIDETAKPVAYVRKGHNRLKLNKSIDYKKIITRIYPLGAGEGVNQLNIKSINGGLPYLQSDAAHINAYGLNEYIWTDRRYTDQPSLKSSAQSMLNELQEPYYEYDVDFIGDCKLGDIVEIVDVIKSFVVEIKVTHGENPRKVYTLANKPYDVAASIADIADRQRVEMTYSQGATQLYADSIADNCDEKTPTELRFYIPDSMKIINAVMCKIRLSRFRAYSKATLAGGSIRTSSAGGQSTQTSSSGGSSVKSTESGGAVISVTETNRQTTQGTSPYEMSFELTNYQVDANGKKIPYASINGKDHFHKVENILPDHEHDNEHAHKIDLPSHTHGMSTPAHTHNVGVPAHTHDVDTIHNHNIEPVIEFFGGATGFALLINGVQKAYYNALDVEVDITDFLVKSGSIPRGTWHTIGILPNGKARAEIAYNVQGFVQSRGDKTV